LAAQCRKPRATVNRKCCLIFSLRTFEMPLFLYCQHSDTKVMHFLFNLLRIKGLYMFRAVMGGAHHVTRHNTPIHNILSTDPQLSISQKALGTLPEDGNVMPKHVGATIHN
jgi:hypothetical protein